MSGLILPYQGVVPTLGPRVFVAPNATVIGDVEVGAEASLWFNVVVRGDVHHIRIGARTNVQDGTVIHVTHQKYPTVIGADITIGHKALLHACTLEDGCFVGMGATVMDAAVIETGAMVAAGALVTPGKRVRTGELWAGAPAKHVRDLSTEERAFFPESVAHYCRLAARYLDATTAAGAARV